jgi:hypothetical protein
LPRITPLKKKKWIAFLEYIGCEFLRNVPGDHILYDRPGLKRPIVFTDDKEISVMLIMSNLKTLGMNREEYLEILQTL